METLPASWVMDPCSPLTKFSRCLNISLLLKHWRSLPIGHSLGAGMQWWIAAIENRSFERVILEYLLCILQRGKPHPHMLKVYPRSYPFFPLLRGTGFAGLH